MLDHDFLPNIVFTKIDWHRLSPVWVVVNIGVPKGKGEMRVQHIADLWAEQELLEGAKPIRETEVQLRIEKPRIV